jgi:L-threonylcarbamoyladenylate synthase
MQALLLGCGLPLAAPSANRSGAVSPTSAAHVVASLGARVTLILDGGSSADGIESTIVALRPDGAWALLRPGPIGKGPIANLLGCDPERAAPHGAQIEAPGQIMSHYAPGKPLRLNARLADPDEFMIGFAGIGGQLSLSPDGDLAEAAGRLYACLHEAAAAAQPRIAVAPVPEDGIGAAINDRLRRAAA